MLTIKPVGSMKSFFDDDEYTIDVKTCIDVIFYIQSMHPRLGLFMKQAQSLATFEDFCFLDAESKIIDPQLFPFHKFKEDDILYIAPVIVGAGGRTGTIIIIVALIAITIAMPYLAPATKQTAAATAKMQTAFVAAQSAFSVTNIVTNIAINMALSLIQQQFVKAPQAQRTRSTGDSGTRSQNDMFGALTNTTKPDSPVALNYGNMRVAGQFLSGYILSQQHAKNDAPTVASIFNANQSPLSAEAEEAA